MMAPRASGPGLRKPGRPVGLQHQPLRTGRDRFHQVVKERFRFHALFSSHALFAQAELLLEPAHHPVAAVDLDLEAVEPGHGRRVGRDERDDLDIFIMGGVDGGGGAVAQAGDGGIQRARARSPRRLYRPRRRSSGSPAGMPVASEASGVIAPSS